MRQTEIAELLDISQPTVSATFINVNVYVSVLMEINLAQKNPSK